MIINIDAPFSLNEENRAQIEAQVSELKRYNDSITRVQVFFKKDDGNVPDGILAEIELHVPGPVHFAAAADMNYFIAFTAAMDKIEGQLRKAKDIRSDHRS